MIKVKSESGKTSKTVLWSTLLGVLGIVELNMSLLQATLGDYYGFTFIGVGIVTYILRTLTSTPLR